jgi:hypothetical protein
MPEAGPLPGQRDLSKPQIVVPPDVQQLLDSLTPRLLRQLDPNNLPTSPDQLQRQLEQIAPQAPPVDNQTTGELLNYLLAP